MRLAVVSPFVDRRHGTERALAELLERLARDYGCEIHLYAQRVEQLAVRDQGPGSPSQSGAIFWHKVPSIAGPHLAQFLGWMILNGFLRRWNTHFRGAYYDLVLSPGINCLHPDVVIVHALFHRLRELSIGENKEREARGGIWRRLHRRIYYELLVMLERRIYADPRIKTAAVSNRMKELLRKYFNRDDVHIAPNGVDTKDFSMEARIARREAVRQRRGFRSEDCVLLLIGNDWRIKGLPTILQAMALLSDLPLRLLVVGNDAPEYFRAQATQLGIQDRCQWELPSQDVIDLYAAADFYVSPSREDSFGLPVAEAMACGLPVVTSGFTGVADFVQNDVDGFVLDEPRDAQMLAQLIRRLQGDEQLRHRVGEIAAKKATDWGWDKQAKVVWELLNEAAKARSHS